MLQILKSELKSGGGNMLTYPVFKLNAVEHKDLASASEVFSLSQFEYYLFVRIPEHIAKVYELYQVDEIVDKAEFVCHKNLWHHDRGRVWYKFHAGMLNKKPGLHVYRLSFVNPCACSMNTIQLYMGYVVQDSDPDKPYIYMNKDGVCGCGCKDIS